VYGFKIRFQWARTLRIVNCPPPPRRERCGASSNSMPHPSLRILIKWKGENQLGCWLPLTGWVSFRVGCRHLHAGGEGNHDYQGRSNRTITGREVIPRPGPMGVHKDCSHWKIPKTSLYSKTSSQPPEIASEDVLFKRTNNRTQGKTPQPTRIG